MLYPIVKIPKVDERKSEHDSLLFQLLHSLGIISPVILHYPDYQENDDIPKDYLSIASSMDCLVDALPFELSGLALTLLDQGVQTVFFNNLTDCDAAKDILASFPRSRVGLSLLNESANFEFVQNIINDFAVVCDFYFFRVATGVPVKSVYDLLKQIRAIVMSTTLQIFVLVPAFRDTEMANLAVVHENIHIVFEPSLRLLPPRVTISSSSTSRDNLLEALSENTTSSNTAPCCQLYNPYSKNAPKLSDGVTVLSEQELSGTTDVLSAFIAGLKSDRSDGLFSTVVCDEQGICLGLVYSNAESIRHAISSKRGVFWSRSRGGLWFKGDSSGMWQELFKVRVDCDGDALRFTVCQHGDPLGCFCHLMTRTCWGDVGGVQRLEALLKDRLRAAPVGSYTKRLFDDPTLLRKKLLEEVQELVEAVEPDHVAAEAADVLYFMMTRCVAAGVTFKDIENHLDRRSLKVTRRPGDAKAWRTAAAEKELNTSDGAVAAITSTLEESAKVSNEVRPGEKSNTT